jgi:hypothetical protein
MIAAPFLVVFEICAVVFLFIDDRRHIRMK